MEAKDLRKGFWWCKDSSGEQTIIEVCEMHGVKVYALILDGGIRRIEALKGWSQFTKAIPPGREVNE